MIELDHPSYAAHTAALAERAEALGHRVAQLGAATDVLLTGWRGRAGDRVRADTEDWLSGAHDVTAGLARTVEALGAHRTDLTARDDETVTTQGRLLARLEAGAR